MFKKFGDENKFALGYEFLKDNDIIDTYGSLKLWIRGNDICEHYVRNEKHSYEGDLYYIVEWICDKIVYIIGYDEFPLPIKGDNVLELLQEAYKYESDYDIEVDLWFDAISRWIFNHCWFTSRGGEILPCVYFRRVMDMVEISWDNDFWLEYDINFCSLKDSYVIEVKKFICIINKFLDSIIFDLARRIGEERQLLELKRKIAFLKV